ncbi:hypothetical protein TNCV_2904611 [Trichonephila clavipes]|nr:hypothetical protein TNCV_2904611 [Trichonephila clavipes]
MEPHTITPVVKMLCHLHSKGRIEMFTTEPPDTRFSSLPKLNMDSHITEDNLIPFNYCPIPLSGGDGKWMSMAVHIVGSAIAIFLQPKHLTMVRTETEALVKLLPVHMNTRQRDNCLHVICNFFPKLGLWRASRAWLPCNRPLMSRS